MKKVLVIRLGAFGDVIQLTPLLRLLKQDGWHVTMNVADYGAPMLDHNPYVDEKTIHVTNSVHPEALQRHWDQMGKGFDKVINLSGSIEQSLLLHPSQREYNWPQEAIHRKCNVNYFDRILELGGYGHLKGLNPELYFSAEEEEWAQKLREQHKNRFVLLWSLAGSSLHKAYPYADFVAKRFLDKYDDAVTITVGDDRCRLIEWDHPHNKKRSGVWSIRKSVIMTKYADLVVAPETGVANAAACFSTPKVILLSHSSVENLTKYWENCQSLTASALEAPCQPCHKLHYQPETCHMDLIEGLPPEFATPYPLCMVKLKQDVLFKAIEDVYLRWKEKRHARTQEKEGAGRSL